MPHPLIAVVGPTASGKSDLGLAIAEKLGGEIVNCDSLQLYRYMNIGTAKTPTEARRGIPHHLIDIIDPDEVFTAGEYSRRAREVLHVIAGRGRIPVVVGGTGFYFRALTEGLFSGPTADTGLRERLGRRSPAQLGKILRRLDKISAERIHPNDKKKQIRAIEVCLITRRQISELQPNRDPLTGFELLTIALEPPRQALYARIDERCKFMFANGLLDETHCLVERFGVEAKALEAIGYAESVRVLQNSLSLEDATEQAQRNTRRYAKRQITWFRREPNRNSLLSFGNLLETIEAAIRLADTHIKKVLEKSERNRV
jgi:tRNA dimethylallyltransferase